MVFMELKEVNINSENKEIKNGFNNQVARVMVYSPSRPDTEGEGALSWYVSIKSPESQSVHLAELAGGRVDKLVTGEYESLEAAAMREIKEELGIFYGVDLELIQGEVEYKLPKYTGSKILNKEASFFGLEILGSENPFPIKPREAKISEVIGLSSREFIEFLTNGKVEVTIEGKKREIQGVEYCQMGLENEVYKDQVERENLFQKTTSYILGKEAEFQKLQNQPNSDEALIKKQARGYLGNFQEDSARLMPALLYMMFGRGNDWQLKSKGLKEILGGLDNESVKEVVDFMRILEVSEIGLDPTEVKDVNEFDRRVSGLCRLRGLMPFNTSIIKIQEDVTSLFSKVNKSIVLKGVEKGQDLDITNEVKNESLLSWLKIIKKGTLMGEGVDTRAIYDAVKCLGIFYSMMKLDHKYEELVKKRDIGMGGFIRENFRKTKLSVKINDENATVRQFKLSNGIKVAVVVDEGWMKSKVSYAIKVLLGEKSDEIGDIYRSSVVIIGKLIEDETGELKIDGLSSSKRTSYATRLAKEIGTRVKDKGLTYGSKSGVEGKLEDNISKKEQNKKEHREGSIGNVIMWIKGYVSGKGEISELAIYKQLGNSDSGFFKGMEWKKADDEYYAAGKVARILGWFFPRGIYSPEIINRGLAGPRALKPKS